MIDRYLLRYFLAVIDHGNFSKAARACQVSQPTLSVAIAKLEGLLATPLFHRTNRRVELTPQGSRFAAHARRIEAEFADAERSVRGEPPARLIRIGLVATLPSGWIGDALAAALATGERVELVEGRMRELSPMLERGRVDVVIGPLGDARGGDALFEEVFAMALPATHALAAQDSVTAQDMAGETMIVRRECEALSDVSRFFTERGVRPFMAARTVNDERAVAYVRAGLGVTVAPRCFAAGGIAMPLLAGFDRRRTIGVTTDAASAGRVADSVAFAAFREVLAGLGNNGPVPPTPSSRA